MKKLFFIAALLSAMPAFAELAPPITVSEREEAVRHLCRVHLHLEQLRPMTNGRVENALNVQTDPERRAMANLCEAGVSSLISDRAVEQRVQDQRMTPEERAAQPVEFCPFGPRHTGVTRGECDAQAAVARAQMRRASP